MAPPLHHQGFFVSGQGKNLLLAEEGSFVHTRGMKCVSVYTASDLNDLCLKKSFLEAHGIACFTQSDAANSIFGLSILPIGPEKGMGPLDLMVDAEQMADALALLRSSEIEESPVLVFLDRDHTVLRGCAGLTGEAPHILTEHFNFIGEAVVGSELYQFFVSEKRWDDLPSEPWEYRGSDWLSLFDTLSSPDSSSFRTAYCSALLGGYSPDQKVFGAFAFAHTPRSSDQLARLVVEGRKTATAGLFWSYEAERVRLPEACDVYVVTDGKARPRALIETTDVRILPFCEVSPEHAALEGEGDLSLESWRKVHYKFFSEECRAIGRTPDERMPVVCERFRLTKIFD
jgi:uncharacterized protein YhfF